MSAAVRWLMKLLSDTRARHARIAALQLLVNVALAGESASERKLRGTLATALNPAQKAEPEEKYRPSPMAASLGWKRRD